MYTRGNYTMLEIAILKKPYFQSFLYRELFIQLETCESTSYESLKIQCEIPALALKLSHLYKFSSNLSLSLSKFIFNILIGVCFQVRPVSIRS